MLRISREKLSELISAAYESGWSGCLELKSEYTEQIMQQFEDACEQAGFSTLTVAASPYSMATSVTDSSGTFVPGYYSNFGQTSPIGTALVNNPGEDAF